MTLESARAAEVLDALARSGQTLAIAESLTGGMLGPDAQGAASVGLVYVAVADARGTSVREHRFAGDRAAIRAQAVDAAIELLAESVGSRE